jgi:ABC-type multidrug transport system ATPase subunit/peptidoglycan/LPS O-acetylase OafA/YrhL
MATTDRFHALDAVRAFALLLGVVFHASLSFTPGIPVGLWAITDTSPSPAIGALGFVAHIFRMSLFFLIAGLFARMMVHRKGVRGFWADRGTRIVVPLIVGWLVLAPTLTALWIWGLTKTFGTLPAPPADMPPPPVGAFPLTHLWFLYYLLILYVLVLTGRALVLALDRHDVIGRGIDTAVGALVRTGTAAIVLPLPLIAALLTAPAWQATSGIPTPDRSVIPELISLIGYGSAMVFGWFVHRQIGVLHVWARQWPLHLGAAVTLTFVCLVYRDAATPAIAVAYGVAIWCWSFGLIGLAMRSVSRPIPAVRYVADASYWIYLVHLPIVIALQVLLGHLPWHWSVKFPLILVVSFVVLFISYHYLVRSTLIGQVLNGRRYPRGSHRDVAAVEPDVRPSHAADPAGGDATSPLAALSGVHQRYGKTVALAGLDLDVRRGELLAVLGPNGAGKSTAIALWLGLLEPDSGSVHLFGRSPLDVETRRSVGVMMQDVALTPELRVRELIDLTASYYANPLTVKETLALTRLESLAHRPYGKLSGGQKRQVQFALAICGRPALLFLDEPTVGLDVEARETMWRTMRALLAQGCSIVLTTHYLEEAEALADRVAVVAAGRLIASGTVASVRSLVSRKEIGCETSLGVEEVRAWPDVVSAAHDGRRLHITAVDAEDVVRRLLAADAGVRDLEVRQAGLAAAFSELTKEVA